MSHRYSPATRLRRLFAHGVRLLILVCFLTGIHLPRLLVFQWAWMFVMADMYIWQCLHRPSEPLALALRQGSRNRTASAQDQV
ncbi:hypothetical protein LZ30DRAFT_710918 [Colletotrichum cereale]|nr:hypothetical protein LZ30DRAFT_710918 [Colletotrichum cereale]